MSKQDGPKILFIDIETKPLLAWVWGLFDQNIGLDQIEEDWRIMSFAAKWASSSKVFQADLRAGLNDKNEIKMLKKIHNLLDEADIVVGQNSKRFDVKKLNEQFLKYGLGRPSPFRQEDTLCMSKKSFSATSHKLEYRSKQLNKKYKKLAHSKYPGFKLWLSCIHGDQKAWKEMAIYNIFDVLATEEYYNVLRPWGSDINLNVYNEDNSIKCACGVNQFRKRGFSFSNSGKYQRFQCVKCRTYRTSKINLLSKEKKNSLKQ